MRVIDFPEKGWRIHVPEPTRLVTHAEMYEQGLRDARRVWEAEAHEAYRRGRIEGAVVMLAVVLAVAAAVAWKVS